MANLFVGISLGSNVIIARSIGEKDGAKLSKAVHTSVIMAILGGLLLTALGELLAPGIVNLLDVPEDVYPLSIKYLRIHGDVLGQILKIGVPAGVQGMVFSFANVIIRSAVNSLGTTVMAASSAAYNLEIFAFYFMNSFGQACTTFVGQNYGAGKNDRCRKTLRLCLTQSLISTATVSSLVLLFSRPLLSLFNTDPDVIATGQIRLVYIFLAYLFSFAQEGLSGYLRGFGVSFIPAACSAIGICGVRLTWVFTVFRQAPSFTTIMQVYPLSLGITAAAILAVTLIVKPSQRYMIRPGASDGP